MSGFGGTEIMTAATKADKAQLQRLNNRLADYMARSNMGKADFDPAQYRAQMTALAEDVNKMKSLYEKEIEKLRGMLEEANRKNAMAASQGTIDDLKRRAAAEAEKAHSLQDDINKLQRALAEKERENAELRAALQIANNELQQIKPHYNRMMKDGEDWKNRFENEAACRKQAEDKIKQLEDKIKFNDQVKGQEGKELAERLKAANDLNRTLEEKVKQLSAARDEAMKEALCKMREGTMAEMRKHQKDTEDALNRNLEALRRQMDEVAQMREALLRERDALAEKVHKLEEMINKLQAENAAIEQQKRALEDALSKMKAAADADRRELEKQIRDLQNLNLDKLKDLNNAREAQGSLQVEINTYEQLLNNENQRLEGKNNSAPAATRGNGQGRTSPGKPPVTATPPTTYRTSFKNPNKSSLMSRGAYQYPSGSASQQGLPTIASSTQSKYTGRF